MSIKWKKDCEASAAALIETLQEVPENTSSRWLPALLDIQIALSEFLNFNSVERHRNTLRLQIVESALSKALQSGGTTSKNFLTLVNDAYREIYETNDTEFHVIASLNIKECRDLPFEKFEHANCIIEVIGNELDEKYSARYPRYTTYKEYSEPCFLKVVVYAKNPSEALRVGINVLDYIRGLINIYNNGRELMYTEPVLINKVQLGYLITCHNPDGTHAGRENYINPSSKFARSATIKNPAVLRTNFHNVDQGIRSLQGHQDLSNVIVFFTRALDEISPQSAFILAWSSLEFLVAPNESNAAERIVARLSFLFTSHSQERAILQGIRMARNEIVHSTTGLNDYLNATYTISDYFIRFLGFIAMNEDRDYTNIKKLLDAPTDIQELQELVSRYERALKFRQGGEA
jgi:hypothetical protein